ncbi:PXMP2 (predicted) [Pycnogonum litorale]
MSSSEENEKGFNIVLCLVDKYQKCLTSAPIITKSITSSVFSCLGNIIAQVLAGKKFSWTSARAFAIFGLLMVGPFFHYLHEFLVKAVPECSQYTSLKRIAIDRLIFTPVFLFVSLYTLNLLQRTPHSVTVKSIRKNFLKIYYDNFRLLSILQWININFIPLKFRVLFGNFMSLLWSIYLAQLKK